MEEFRTSNDINMASGKNRTFRVAKKFYRSGFWFHPANLQHNAPHWTIKRSPFVYNLHKCSSVNRSSSEFHLNKECTQEEEHVQMID